MASRTHPPAQKPTGRRLKHQLDRQARLEREMLLGQDYELRNRRIANADESMLNKATDITESLQRMRQLMSQEVERGALSAKILDDSSKSLRSIHHEYQGFAGVMRASRQLITKLEQGDWADRLLIFFGFLVFLLVVVHILKRRFWDHTFGWAAWMLWGRRSEEVAATTYKVATQATAVAHTHQLTKTIAAAVVSSLTQAVPQAAPQAEIHRDSPEPSTALRISEHTTTALHSSDMAESPSPTPEETPESPSPLEKTASATSPVA
ncbi:uncharacterized protein VTP21DRAFT_7923 [Calcarisporiella thermophila]|uniref:uncharacterized protein n=1 Tax=Calcarisporiella thermophila TaxID=911321 RepID=UPI003743D814